MIKGVSLLFAMNQSQALQEEGTISGEGNAGEEVYQKLLDHPEGVLAVPDQIPTENWELVRTPDKMAVLDTPELLDRFRQLEIPEDTDFRTRDPTSRSFYRRASARTTLPTPFSATRPGARRSGTATCACTRRWQKQLGVSDGETVRLDHRARERCWFRRG